VNIALVGSCLLQGLLEDRPHPHRDHDDHHVYHVAGLHFPLGQFGFLVGILVEEPRMESSDILVELGRT